MAAFVNGIARWARNTIKDSFLRIGVDVRTLDHTEGGILRRLLEATRPAAVLDVGANIGQYARQLRAVGYRGTIVSFEAVEAIHARLVLAAQEDPAWIVAPCLALGSAPARSSIKVSANTVSSSLLTVLPASVEVAPLSNQIDVQLVEIARLDDVLPRVLPSGGDLFLKIDTQGYENEVLLGARGTLARTTALQLELSLTPLYAGAPVMWEMIRNIEERGFELFNLVPGFRDPATGRLLQADGFFVRSLKSADS